MPTVDGWPLPGEIWLAKSGSELALVIHATSYACLNCRMERHVDGKCLFQPTHWKKPYITKGKAGVHRVKISWEVMPAIPGTKRHTTIADVSYVTQHYAYRLS